jgi:hypothetical protein
VYFKAMKAKELVSTVLGTVAPNLMVSVDVEQGAPARTSCRTCCTIPCIFPSVPVSKRYLGFRNVVYDLEEKCKRSAGRDARNDPEVVPFNFLDKEFPCDVLERAKKTCPVVFHRPRIGGRLLFTFPEGPVDCELLFPTPLFEGPP